MLLPNRPQRFADDADPLSPDAQRLRAGTQALSTTDGALPVDANRRRLLPAAWSEFGCAKHLLVAASGKRLLAQCLRPLLNLNQLLGATPRAGSAF